MFRLSGYFHPDYPLLTTSFIARSWFLHGYDNLFVCHALAVIMMVGCVLVPAAALATQRNRFLGAFCVLNLLLVAGVPVNAARLMADIPFAFFVTSSVVVWSLRSRFAEGETGWVLGTGIFLGLAVWTKSEGLLWLACFLTMIGVSSLRRRNLKSGIGTGLLLLLGAAPGILVLVWFKSMIPYEDIPFLMPRLPLGDLDKLLDFHRVSQVLLLMVGGGVEFGGFGILAFAVFHFLTGINWKAFGEDSMQLLFGVLFLVGIGYVSAFVVSRNSVLLEVPATADRLLTHLWPSLVYLSLMVSKIGFIGEEESTLKPVSS